jgi:hypothetical protein
MKPKVAIRGPNASVQTNQTNIESYRMLSAMR